VRGASVVLQELSRQLINMCPIVRKLLLLTHRKWRLRRRFLEPNPLGRHISRHRSTRGLRIRRST
jgi:hypothetical protein